MIFERFPRTGIPDAFESLSEYDDYLACSWRPAASIMRRKFGGTSAFIRFSTPSNSASATRSTRVDDTIALAALMQA